jgi:hypothetical protein
MYAFFINQKEKKFTFLFHVFSLNKKEAVPKGDSLAFFPSPLRMQFWERGEHNLFLNH